MSDRQADSYDQMIYPGFIFPQIHPDRLAAIAKFCGMKPPPADKSRVLELGCGIGLNLNWLAANLPQSEFVGIDLAANHIEEAEKIKNDLSLSNISFSQMDILDLSENDFGKFDYIIAHGLISWVPDFVREKVLSLCDELLSPNGIVLISYNVYPGFYRRQMVRDIMIYHTGAIANPLIKVEEGMGLIDFLSGQTNDLFREILHHELNHIGGRHPSNIYHDDFAEINQAFYFTDFVREAEKHNLQFLSENEYFPFQPNNIPEEAAKVFAEISPDTIGYEQYSDFVKCRQFRQTLLCKKDTVLNRDLDPLKLKDFYISSYLRAASPEIDLNPNSPKQFINARDGKVDIFHNLSKVTLTVLNNLGWHLQKFDELCHKAKDILQSQGIAYDDSDKEIGLTANALLQLYSPHGINFHTVESNAVEFISEKPIADKFSRWLATENDYIINFYGFELDLTYSMRALINLLDGTRTRENLIAELTDIYAADNEIADKESALAEIPETLDRNLFVLAKTGFLIG